MPVSARRIGRENPASAIAIVIAAIPPIKASSGNHGRGRDGSFVVIALPLLAILLPLSFALSRDLDLLALGRDRAGTLGVNVRRLNGYALTLAVALASIGVAVCGPIAFISLVVPHLVRRLFGGLHRYLLPLSALTGGLVLLLADLLARTLHPPLELPAGVLTAIIGAPWFIWLLVRMR